MTAPDATPVLILTGAPGVGKTTTARILAARSDRAVHLESDLFFRFIQSGYIDPWKPESHEQNRIVMRIVADAASAYAAAGYFTIVDGIIIPGWFLEPLRDSLREAGHLVAYAVLRAPLPVCASRARSRGSQSLADPEVVERLWKNFAELGPLEPNAIDIGTSSPEDAADLLARRLQDGLLAT
ncbi:MAG TPA: AAA family ATPase [Solirubrobacterales bacterium]|nr:AAA family ATPase [Solirubrobacterales bacterium]